MAFPWDLPQAHLDAIRNGDQADREREHQRKIADDDKESDRQFWGAHQAKLLQYQTGHTSEEWRAAAQQVATVREGRNPFAEYGSEQRSAVFVGDMELAPIERARPGSMARSVLPDEQLLARARLAGADSFMREQVRRFDQRQQASGRTISRSGTAGHVECVECDAEGLTEAESFDVHYHPRFGDPLPPTTIPDYAPQRSKRVRAGTGWPEIAR